MLAELSELGESALDELVALGLRVAGGRGDELADRLVLFAVLSARRRWTYGSRA
jgi:hypothetical protein